MTETFVDQNEQGNDSSYGPDPTDAHSGPREMTPYEKRLKRDLSRAREEFRITKSEYENNTAALIQEKELAISAIRAQTSNRIIHSELKAHALKAGIIDLDALRLADVSALVVGESGEVVGVDSLIDRLRQEKPYLFAEARVGVHTGTTGQLQRPPSPAAPSTMDARTLSREAWQEERNRLLNRDQGR